MWLPLKEKPCLVPSSRATSLRGATVRAQSVPSVCLHFQNSRAIKHVLAVLFCFVFFFFLQVFLRGCGCVIQITPCGSAPMGDASRCHVTRQSESNQVGTCARKNLQETRVEHRARSVSVQTGRALAPVVPATGSVRPCLWLRSAVNLLAVSSV